jgi:hypothetical protein
MRSFFFALSIASLLFFPACLEKEKPQIFLELSLYTGIPGVARLGETYQKTTQNAAYAWESIGVPQEPAYEKLGFTDVVYFKAVGTRVYFRRGGVAMIVAQEPFKGIIKSKNIHLFAFSVPPVSDWEAHLLKELGMPEARASGGRFSSEGLFYSWGDISYNRMGPNEIALYRDSELSKFRTNNFGRELKFFPDQGKKP